jgi:hypothetical protein
MKRFALLFAGLFLFASLAFSSGGAGGAFSGLVEPSWSYDLDGLIAKPVNEPYKLGYMGGYGYQVDDEGFILGGFGLAFADKTFLSGSSVDPHIAGGALGLVIGQRVIGADFLHFDIGARLGLGGCYVSEWTGAASPRDRSGFMILYAEPYAELGIGFFAWAHLSVTAGFQVMGNWLPALPFEHFLTWTPTVGISLSVGSFYF